MALYYLQTDTPMNFPTEIKSVAQYRKRDKNPNWKGLISNQF